MSLKNIYSTPELQAETSTGKNKYWQGHVLTDDMGGYFTQTSFWQQTAKGLSERQLSVPTRVEGKNIGRANETTPEFQARFEIDSTEKKQRDKGYHEAGEDISNKLILPMLAHEWSKRKHSVKFPLFAQPKLDGCRCLMQDGQMWSRKGKLFIPKIVEHLLFDAGEVIIDGELMLPHDQFTFQEGMSATKRYDKDISPMLHYHVYDCYLPGIPDAGFRDRYRILTEIVQHSAANLQVVLVQTEPVASEDEMLRWHHFFTDPEQGFEGTIARTPDGLYKPDLHRSVDLLKHKDFVDKEYEIVGVGDGKGKFEGAIMFTLVTPEGRTFECGLKGPMKVRQEMFAKKDTYIGRQLKVKFQNLSDDGIPRFPVGIAVRDQDMEG